MAKKIALALTPAQKRKREAIRKAVTKLLGDDLGPQVAEKGFQEWLAKNPVSEGTSYETIAKALYRVVQSKELKIPREGIIVHLKRGRKNTPVHALPYVRTPAKSRKAKRQKAKLQAAR